MATLQTGSQGQEVRDLQNALNELSVVKGGIKVDGIFGPETKNAVQTFQKKDGLPVDGIAGQNTISEIVRLLGHPIKVAPPDANMETAIKDSIAAQEAKAGIGPWGWAGLLLVGGIVAKKAKWI